jgi:adenine phosphoribosyltransferase
MDLNGKDWAGILIYDVHGSQEYWLKYFCAEAEDKQLFHDGVVNKFTHKWGSPVTYGQLLHEQDPSIPANDWMSAVTGKPRQQALEEGLLKLSKIFLNNMKMISELESAFVVYPDWPKPGVDFKDWTPIFHNPNLIDRMTNLLSQPYTDFSPETTGDRLVSGLDPGKIDYVVGLESRGIWLAVPLALKLNAGMVPIRKPGKIPGEIFEERYKKEYGEDILQISAGLQKGKRVLIVDDVLATGGSLKAAICLVERAGLEIAGCAVVTDVPELRDVASETLKGYTVRVLIKEKIRQNLVDSIDEMNRSMAK